MQNLIVARSWRRLQSQGLVHESSTNDRGTKEVSYSSGPDLGDIRQKSSRGLNEATVVTRDESTVGATELRTGRSVVVDAHGDSLEELLVQKVRIVPSLAPE